MKLLVNDTAGPSPSWCAGRLAFAWHKRTSRPANDAGLIGSLHVYPGVTTAGYSQACRKQRGTHREFVDYAERKFDRAER